MTFEISIPDYIQPFGWELCALEVIDAVATGFDPEAVELRSVLLVALLEAYA